MFAGPAGFAALSRPKTRRMNLVISLLPRECLPSMHARDSRGRDHRAPARPVALGHRDRRALAARPPDVGGSVAGVQQACVDAGSPLAPADPALRRARAALARV